MQTEEEPLRRTSDVLTSFLRLVQWVWGIIVSFFRCTRWVRAFCLGSVSWSADKLSGRQALVRNGSLKALRRNGSVIGSRSLCGTCSAVAQLTTLWRKFVDTLQVVQVVHPSRVLVERVSWDSNGFQFHNFTPHLLEHQLRSPSQPAATYSLRSFPEQNRTYANLT